LNSPLRQPLLFDRCAAQMQDRFEASRCNGQFVAHLSVDRGDNIEVFEIRTENASSGRGIGKFDATQLL
jgi:hypothetical protein